MKLFTKRNAIVATIVCVVLTLVAAIFFLNKPKDVDEPSKDTHYTVAFETNGGDKIKSQSVVSGSLVTKPTDPKKEGYAFMGWFSDEKLTIEFDFSKPVDSNLTLYAKWDGESTPADKEEVEQKEETSSTSQPSSDKQNDKPSEPTPEPQPRPAPEPVISYAKEVIDGSVTNQVRIFVLRDGVKVDGTVRITYLGGKSAIVTCPASTGYVEDGGIIVSISEPKI